VEGGGQGRPRGDEIHLRSGQGCVQGADLGSEAGQERRRSALRRAAARIANELADKLFDGLIDGLFKSGESGFSFGGIGKLLGFDTGGYTGPGRKSSPRGGREAAVRMEGRMMAEISDQQWRSSVDTEIILLSKWSRQ
jgi:hypothetical protein